MGDLPEFEPAPPVAVGPPHPRFWTRRTVLVATLVVVVVVTATILLTPHTPGPGEPGWRPLTGQEQNHSSTGEAGLQFAQVLENSEDVDVVIESVRAEAPAGLAVKETGQLSMQWLSEYYLFSPPTLTHLPVTVRAGKDLKFVVRFKVTCPPAQPATRIRWRLFLTVSAGSVRQEVEVGSLRDIELQDSSLPAFCDTE